jgi:CheY-like chemotaxis protein
MSITLEAWDILGVEERAASATAARGASAGDSSTRLADSRVRSILIVDDEEETRVLLRTILERAGYIVLEASNGREALERLAVVEPSLILLDLEMPVMSGWDFLGIVNCHRRLSRIPILVISAWLDRGALGRASISRLAKPIKARELLTKVAEILPIGANV